MNDYTIKSIETKQTSFTNPQTPNVRFELVDSMTVRVQRQNGTCRHTLKELQLIGLGTTDEDAKNDLFENFALQHSRLTDPNHPDPAFKKLLQTSILNVTKL